MSEIEWECPFEVVVDDAVPEGEIWLCYLPSLGKRPLPEQRLAVIRLKEEGSDERGAERVSGSRP